MIIVKTKQNINKGFSLVETLIALSIFSLSILAVMMLLHNGISDIGYAKKKMTASYLAQEGIEYFRNIRDSYSISSDTAGGEGWHDFNEKINVCKHNENQKKACYFRNQKIFENEMSIFDIVLSACGGSCPYMRESGEGGYESDSSYSGPGFVREISIIDVNANEIKVSSTVYWTQKSGDYKITFTGNLLNWIE